MIIFNHLPKFIRIMSENTFYCKVACNINLTYATRVREPNSTPTKPSVMKKRPGSPRFDRRTHSVPEQGLQCPGASWRRCCGLAPRLSQLSQDQLLMKPTAVSCWKLKRLFSLWCALMGRSSLISGKTWHFQPCFVPWYSSFRSRTRVSKEYQLENFRAQDHGPFDGEGWAVTSGHRGS